MSLRQWRAPVVAVLGALAIVVSACGGAAPSSRAPAGGGTAAPAGSAPPGSAPAGSAPAGSAPASARGSAAPTLTLAYVAPSASQAAAWIAKDEGFFKQNGLNVRLTFITGGASPTAALISGHVQAMQIALEVTAADLSGAQLVYVAAPLSLPLFSLVAVPSITSPARLRGKRVGMTGYGTATYYADIIALQHFGLDPSRDVVLTSSGSLPAILAAMKAGQMQAAALSMPLLAAAEKQGMHVLGNVADMGIRYPNSWLAVTRRFATQHPREVLALVRSTAQADAFEVQHPKRAMAIIGRYTHITNPALLRQTYEATAPYLNRVPMPSVRDVAEGLKLMASRTPAARSANPASFVDTHFVQQLVAGGFLAKLYPGGAPAGPGGGAAGTGGTAGAGRPGS